MTRGNFLASLGALLLAPVQISTSLGNVPTILRTIQLSIPTSSLEDHNYLNWLMHHPDSELVNMATKAGIDLDKEFNLAMGYYGTDFAQMRTTIQITQTQQKTN